MPRPSNRMLTAFILDLDIREGARSCLNLMCHALGKPMEGCPFLNGDGGDEEEVARKRKEMGGETSWYVK